MVPLGMALCLIGQAGLAPLPAEALTTAPADARAGELMAAYHGSVRQWAEIVTERAEPVPGRPDAIYYGRGGHAEDDVRPICYAALVNAFLATVPAPDGAPVPVDARREDAIAALRYLTDSHVTGGGQCVDGEQWGGAWQSAMWTRSAGLAGWMLWDDLPEELRKGVRRMVEFEAHRILTAEPKSSEFRDTGAEENAWNAQILSLAANMMPDHAYAEMWAGGARYWMYNVFSVAADAGDARPGDDGQPIGDWVTTVNAHPDFTVENHGLVHIGYLKTSLALLLENALPYLLTGSPVPLAARHHAGDAFELLVDCMAWDGAPVFFGGNDWKIYHSQNTDVLIYALMSLLAGDGVAARLESEALSVALRMQEAEGGYYNCRRDLEYGGLVATRLIAAYLAHAALGAGAEPATAEEFDERCCGLRLLEDGRAVIHRTPTKFASFTWGPKRMGLALPVDGTWLLWPHFESYIGSIEGMTDLPAGTPVPAFVPHVEDDAFWVIGGQVGGEGRVRKDIAFASLPTDVVIYVERLRREPGAENVRVTRGTIGLEYPLGGNTRKLYSAEGALTVRGLGGEAKVTELASDWLNVGNQVGYVVRRLPVTDNLIRHFDATEGTGRVPKLQERITLLGDPQSLEEWACIVTFLNVGAEDTQRLAESVELSVDGDRVRCTAEGAALEVDFAAQSGEMRTEPFSELARERAPSPFRAQDGA